MKSIFIKSLRMNSKIILSTDKYILDINKSLSGLLVIFDLFYLLNSLQDIKFQIGRVAQLVRALC